MNSRHYILISIFTLYCILTFAFAIKFNRTQSIFTSKQKLFHSIMIWLIPFIWIILLQNLSQSSPGSHHYPNKRSDNDDISNTGIDTWCDTGSHDAGGHDASGFD